MIFGFGAVGQFPVGFTGAVIAVSVRETAAATDNTEAIISFELAVIDGAKAVDTTNGIIFRGYAVSVTETANALDWQDAFVEIHPPIDGGAGFVQVVGDRNSGNGLVLPPVSHDFFQAAGLLIAVDNTAVTDHAPDHTGVKTANGSSFFSIQGKPVNSAGDADTCGHVRVGNIVNWFIIGGA